MPKRCRMNSHESIRILAFRMNVMMGQIEKVNLSIILI